ncbi:MAG: endonuclease MutS2 [Myxococcota bacterium]
MRVGSQNRLLGWQHILAALAARTNTIFGREQADSLEPPEGYDGVLERLSDIESLRTILQKGEKSPLGEVPDVRKHLRRVSKEGVLDGSSLREIAQALRAGSEAAHFISRNKEVLVALAERWPDLGGGEPLARKIERSVDASGEVTDDASPEVADARSRVRSLHAKLRRTAEEMTRSKEWVDKLQEPYFSVRGDRYVLPVKASFRYQVGGIVHNVSNTGETVFIEPPALISQGNELAVAIAEEEEAVRMVLAELTRLVGARAGAIESDLVCIGSLDSLFACAQLAEDLDASTPRIAGGEDPSFELLGLRHPLLVLQGKKVVENDVKLEGEERALVVSGPNAGGKTVTITAVALSAIMLRHGLPIPAEAGSTLPVYRDVQAVLGDEQDLERDLSTFSAHLQALKEVLESAGAMDLIVIDEMCADTDPREGAALAAAVLEKLLDKGASVLVTTHFEALKALAAGNPRYLAAAVGFDAAKMQPTYRLRLHVSGGSSAVEIAARIGLPEDVLSSARAHLSGDGGALASALSALEKSAARADEEAQKLRELQAKADEERAKLAAAKAALDADRRKVRHEARAELLKEIEEARRKVKETIARLQAEPSMRKTVRAEEELESIESGARIDEARDEEQAAAKPSAPGPKVQPDKAAKGGAIAPGSFVRAPTVGDREGEVIDVDERGAQVAFGALKMRLPFERLVLLERPARRAVKAKMRSSESERAAKAESMRAQAVSGGDDESVVDLRGMRVDEALAFLDKRLDELLSEGVARARVVHGHGTGALRRAVREHLAISPHVAGTEIPGDEAGGDGATCVRLDV